MYSFYQRQFVRCPPSRGFAGLHFRNPANICYVILRRDGSGAVHLTRGTKKALQLLEVFDADCFRLRTTFHLRHFSFTSILRPLTAQSQQRQSQSLSNRFRTILKEFPETRFLSRQTKLQRAKSTMSTLAMGKGLIDPRYCCCGEHRILGKMNGVRIDCVS